MIKVVCGVRDSAAQVYGQPWFVPSTGVAVRGFSDAVRGSDKNDLTSHPEDFTLFQLGTFDDETGKFVNLPEAVQLIRGVDILRLES